MNKGKEPRHIPLSVRLAILTFDKIALVGWGFAAVSLVFSYFVSSISAGRGDWMTLATTLGVPAIGVCIALANIRVHLREIEVLRRGKQTFATFDRKEQRRHEKNGSLIGEPMVFLKFTDDEGEAHSFYHETEGTHLEDAKEIIFYDPYCPPVAVALDYLPGKLELQGNIFKAHAPVWRYLVLPALTIAGILFVCAVASPMR